MSTIRRCLCSKAAKIPAEGAETVRTIWTAKAEALRAALPETVPGLAGKLRDELLRIPPVGGPSFVETKEGLLLTTDPGVQVAVLRVGNGPRAVIWVGERDFRTEAQREEVKALARHATVFVLEPRGAATPRRPSYPAASDDCDGTPPGGTVDL